MAIIASRQLARIATEIFKAAGCSRGDAEFVADNLVTANLYGHDSHGVLRIRPYVQGIRKGLIKPGGAFTVVRETATTALVNGNLDVGEVTARKAMELAVEKAKTCGVGIVSVFNCNHIGRVGSYPEIALKHNMIGIALVSGGGSNTAPYGGIDPVFGTNPISIAIPAAEERPILLDMATSTVAGGKVSLAMARKEQIPLEWGVIDHEGAPSTDPTDLRPFYGQAEVKPRGALLPFGGYKGSGLCLIIQILSDALAGGGKIYPEIKGSGAVMMAVDIGVFRPVEDFKRNVDKILRDTKSSRKAPGVKNILMPGEPEYDTCARRLETGIYVEDETWEAINRTAEELKVDIEGILKA